ncbi:MAG: YqjF family protein [Rubrobacteraceae bacterium]
MATNTDKTSPLDGTEHRPYPLPDGPWVLSMSWRDLLFMHWPVPEGVLRPLIPRDLELDTFDGSAWLGVVPFRMTGVRPRFLPGVPWLSNFPELNLRTYVSAGGKPGIWFFSLDAHNPVAVRIARATFKLPYFDAKMSCRTSGDTIHYNSTRTHRGVPEASFVGGYRPTGETFDSRPGTLENFLTERYCLYAGGDGRVMRGDIHHSMRPLQSAEVEVEKLVMTEQIGLEQPDSEPLLHYARRLDVVAWPPHRITQ